MRKPSFVERAQKEHYLHKDVWRVVDRQLRHAEAHPAGAFYDHLVAMVFCALTLEGYANYLLERIAPDLWADEKELFKRDGLRGKVSALRVRCGLPPLPKGRRPFSTLSELIKLRNSIAHPRTISSQPTETRFVDGKEPPLFRPSHLETLVSLEKALRARDDVKDLIAELHAAAQSLFAHAVRDPQPLDGIMSLGSVVVSAAPGDER